MSMLVISQVPLSKGLAGSQRLATTFMAKDDGFVQWFVVNESNKEVRFDDHSDRIASSQLFEEHYYPFGLPMTGICVEGYEMRRFTSKEMQADLGWQDHGARFYDPALGRWTAPDPLAEEYPSWSPYRYGFNNPMVFTDPTGLIKGQYMPNEEGGPDGFAIFAAQVEVVKAVVDKALKAVKSFMGGDESEKDEKSSDKKDPTMEGGHNYSVTNGGTTEATMKAKHTSHYDVTELLEFLGLGGKLGAGPKDLVNSPSTMENLPEGISTVLGFTEEAQEQIRRGRTEDTVTNPMTKKSDIYVHGQKVPRARQLSPNTSFYDYNEPR